MNIISQPYQLRATPSQPMDGVYLRARRVTTIEPKEKASFGWVLWKILGGNDAHFTKAAELLGINRVTLSLILHDKKNTSKTLLIKKEWRTVLAKSFPDAWQNYQEEFEKYADNLPRTLGSYSTEPSDKKSFGWLLWKITDGKNADMGRVATLLQTSGAYLSGIMHGKHKISKKFLADKQWEETLAKFFPDGWAENAESFKIHANALPNKKGKQSQEPSDKESFGWVVWQIIGGKDADIKKCAELLKINRAAFSAVLQGQRHPTQTLIAEKKWQETLSNHFPENWEKYRVSFEKHAAILRTGQTKPSSKELSIENQWRLAVGIFVRDILQERGDDIQDIVGNIKIPQLKKEAVWKKIMSGDQKTHLNDFAMALRLICDLYCLSPDHPSTAYTRAQALRTQFDKGLG